MSITGFVAQANAEIRAAQEAHEIQKAGRQLLRRPIALTDELINDLEMLNLKRIVRVPVSYEPRLLQLRAMLGETVVTAEQLDNLRTRIGTTRLMDCLYAVQGGLFAQTHPDIPRELGEWDRFAVFSAA